MAKHPGQKPVGTAITGISTGPTGINQSNRPGFRPGGSQTLGSRSSLQKTAGVRPLAGRGGRRR